MFTHSVCRIAILVCIASPFDCLAEVPDSLWGVVLGDERHNEYPSIVVTSQDEIVVCYSSISDTAAGWVLVKFDRAGTFLWQRDFFTNDVIFRPQMAATNDGGFVVSSHKSLASFDEVCQIFKLDSLGDIEWQREIDHVAWVSMAHVSTTSNGEIVIGLSLNSVGGNFSWGFGFVRLSEEGDSLRGIDYQNSNSLSRDMWDMTLTTNNELLFCGMARDSDHSDYPAAFAMLCDAEGDSVWYEQLVGGIALSCAENGAGQFGVVSFSDSTGYEYDSVSFVLMEHSGAINVVRSYHFTSNSFVKAVCPWVNDSFLMLGQAIVDQDIQAFVMCHDSEGDSAWTLFFGGGSLESGSGIGAYITATHDSGFVAAIGSLSYNPEWPGYDVLMVRYGPGESASFRGGNLLVPEFAQVSAYPNPFNSTTEITFEMPRATRAVLKVYDLLGRERTTLLDGFAQSGTTTVRWDAGEFASGIYFVRLAAGEEMVTRKVVLLK